jgi:battenin
VLLADVFPSFVLKLIAPYFIDRISYTSRVLVFCALSAIGMLVISLSPANQEAGTIGVKLLGVGLASLSSGGGELSFLALTHFYGQSSLAAWSSGTGGAGLVGAWLYVVATTTLKLSSSTTLLACALFPVIMLGSYFLLLPTPEVAKESGYEALGEDEDDDDAPPSLLQPAPTVDTSIASSLGTSTMRDNFKRVKVLFMP